MKRLTLSTLLPAYIAGLLAATNLNLPFLSVWAAIIPALLWLSLPRRNLLAALFLHLLFFILGVSLFQLCRTPDVPADHITRLNGTLVTLDATVVELKHSQDDYAIDLDDLTVVAPDPPRRSSGRLRVQFEEAPDIFTGDRIRIRGTIRIPQLFGSPGEADTPGFLAAAGIHARLAVTTPPSAVLLQSSDKDYFLARHRQTTGSLIDSVVPRETAGLVRALATGDFGGERATRDLLARSGLSHLFSISGLHLGLIAAGLYGILLLIWRRFSAVQHFPPARFAPLLIAPLLLLYLFWSGNAYATQRALLMFLGAALLLLLRRRTTPLRLLALTVFLLLLYNPMSLFSPSLQLSVAGVAGIILVQPLLEPYLDNRPNWQRATVRLLAATAAASLATLPIVLYHFHLFAPAGLPINLFAIPIVSWLTVPLVLCATLLVPAAPSLAAILFRAGGETIDWVLTGSRAILALPGCGGSYHYLSLVALGGITLIACAVLIPRLPLPLRCTTAGLGLVALLAPLPQPATLTVTALSVGQGEAILISPDGQQQILVDAGGLYGDFDTGQRLVAPALGRLGVTMLDAVVMTHPHPDHSKGLSHILQNFYVRELWLDQNCQLPPALAAIAAERGIVLRRFPAGWTRMTTGGDAQLALFSTGISGDNVNDQSLVLYARNQKEGTLLTGDLEADGVQRLLLDPPPGPVTLLKLPHHGSRRSTPLRLVDRFNPRQIFVSAGRDNRFHFPHDDIVAGIRTRGIPLARTDRDGTLRFIASRTGWLTNP